MKERTGKNYEAWGVKVENFPIDSPVEKQLSFLINYAVLAPSTHNSQPWVFQIRNNKIRIKKNSKRALKIADGQENLMYISLGCALENLLIASDYFGFKHEINYFLSDLNDVTVCEVVFNKKSGISNYNKHFIFSIPQRHTNRGKYDNKIPKQGFLEEIKNFFNEDVGIEIISDVETKEKITEIMLLAREDTFSDKEFRNELAGHQRNNLTKSFTGMPGFTMGFPSILSFLTPTVVRKINVMKIIKNKDRELLNKHTPLFLIIKLKEVNKKNCLLAGRFFERIALMAESRGLHTAFQEIPLHIDKLQEILGTKHFPKIFFRMGYALKKMGHSPRIPAKKTII